MRAVSRFSSRFALVPHVRPGALGPVQDDDDDASLRELSPDSNAKNGLFVGTR